MFMGLIIHPAVAIVLRASVVINFWLPGHFWNNPGIAKLARQHFAGRGERRRNQGRE